MPETSRIDHKLAFIKTVRKLQAKFHPNSLFVDVWCCLPMSRYIVLHQRSQLSRSCLLLTNSIAVAKARVSMSRLRAFSLSLPSGTFDFAFPCGF